MKKEMTWIDLSEYGIQMIMTKLQNNNKYLVAWGVDEESTAKLKRMSFIARKSDPSIMFASSDVLAKQFFKTMKELFPKSKPIKLPIEDIIVPDLKAWATSQSAQSKVGMDASEKEAAMNKDMRDLKIELSQELLLGRNSKNEKVYTTPEGRVVLGQDGEKRRINFKSDKTDFLMIEPRAGDADFVKVVEGFANDIFDGQIMHFEQLKNICSVIYDMDFQKHIENSADAGAGRMLRVESAINQTLMNRSLEMMDNFDGDEEVLAGQLDDVFTRRPLVSASYLAQGSNHAEVSPSFAYAINTVIKKVKPENVTITSSSGGYLELMVGKGSNVNSLVVNGVVNPSKSEAFSPAINDNIKFKNKSNTTLSEASAEFVFISEPFQREVVMSSSDEDSKKSLFFHDGVNYSRIDLRDAAKALSVMKDEGSAIIAVQEPIENSGVNSGEFSKFLEYIAPRYGIKDIVEMDGSLLGRSGESNNLRVIYVEGRNIIPDLEFSIPETIDFLRSNEEVRGLATRWLKDEEVIEVDDADKDAPRNLSDILKESNARFKGKVVTNEFQTKYIPGSQVSDGFTMVPKELAGPSRRALAKVVRDVGDLDDYVADELHMSKGDLSDSFCAEQVDAIALAIWRDKQNKAMLIGDATGVGKGRELAGYMRYKLVNGETVAFLTENESLFKDIMRDFKDIKSDHLIRPYVVDNNKKLFDADGNVMDVGSTRRNESILEGKVKADDANFFIGSYYQIRSKKIRSGQPGFVKSSKNIKQTSQARLLSMIGEQRNSALVADEIHNAVTHNSGTNNAFDELLAKYDSFLCSSGTSSRHSKNMGFYWRLFPGFESSQELVDVMSKGGDTLTEHMIQMLTADGGYIRREHDFSRATFINAINTREEAETRHVVDSFARIMSLLGTLGATSKKHIFNEEYESQLGALVDGFGGTLSKKSSLNVGSMHFNSRFNNLTRQFLVATENKHVINTALESLKGNRKPLITLNNTGNSFLKRYHVKMIDLAQRKANGEELSDFFADKTPVLKDGEWIYSSRPTFKDVIALTLEESLYVSFDKKGNSKNRVSVELTKLVPNKHVAQEIEELTKYIHTAIEAFPDLDYAPIDSLKDALKGKGLMVEELTGRNMHVKRISDSGFVITAMAKPDRIAVVDRFNRGHTDVIVSNKAGCTGISAHAGKNFDDQRQREMIGYEILPNIVDQVQMLGRINRNNQVEDPVYTNIVSGIPAHNFQISAYNNKMRSLSANTTSSRNSPLLQKAEGDFLNKVGDHLIANYVLDNPELAEMMGIDLSDIKDPEKGKTAMEGFATKFAGYIIRLDYDTQIEVFNDVAKKYQEEIKLLESREVNPLNPKTYNWDAEVVRSVLVSGEDRTYYESEFERPVKVVEIEYHPEVERLNTKDILESISNGEKASQEGYQDIFGTSDINEVIQIAKERFDASKAKQQELFDYNNDPQFNRFCALCDGVVDIIPNAEVGSIVMVKKFASDSYDMGVITGLSNKDKNPLDWMVHVQTPGSLWKDSYKLRELVVDVIKGIVPLKFNGEKFSETHELAFEFDKTRSSFHTESRVTLEGNILACTQLAKEIGSGSVSKYRGSDGIVKSCVLMPKNTSFKDIAYRPVVLKGLDTILDYAAFNNRANSRASSFTMKTSANFYEPTKDVALNIDFKNSKLLFNYPKNKVAGAFAKTTEFNDLWDSSSSMIATKQNKTITAELTLELLRSVVDFLEENNMALYTNSEGREFLRLRSEGSDLIDREKALLGTGLDPLMAIQSDLALTT